jgi:transposase
MVRLIEDLAADWRRLDERIEGLSAEIKIQAGGRLRLRATDDRAWHRPDHLQRDGCGDRHRRYVLQRPRLRRLAGLVPKQISTGDRTILGKISKRGNRYLRVLFVQAAWVVLIKPQSWERHGLKPWIEAAKKRLHRNVLAIALANKLARIAWSVLARGRSFEARPVMASAA